MHMVLKNNFFQCKFSSSLILKHQQNIKQTIIMASVPSLHGIVEDTEELMQEVTSCKKMTQLSNWTKTMECLKIQQTSSWIKCKMMFEVHMQVDWLLVHSFHFFMCLPPKKAKDAHPPVLDWLSFGLLLDQGKNVPCCVIWSFSDTQIARPF